MAERLSAGDRLARLGGDELALVRPGLDDRQAVSLGEAIAADLAQLRVDGLWRPIRVHVGAATVRAGDPIAPRTSCTGPTWRWPGPSRSRPPRSPCSTRRWRPAPAASPS